MAYITQVEDFVDGKVLHGHHLINIDNAIIENENAIAAKADKDWVSEQIQAAIDATWEAEY